MNIYIAAAYARREEAKRIARVLEAYDHTITARWLEGPPESEAASPEQQASYASRDIADLHRSNALIVLTSPRESPETSGHHWEAGYFTALAQGPVWVFGPAENIFYAREGYQFESAVDALVLLTKRGREKYEGI